MCSSGGGLLAGRGVTNKRYFNSFENRGSSYHFPVTQIMRNKKIDDSYFHILKYTSIFGWVQGIGILVDIVRNKLVAMILGPNGMGLISLFNSTIKLISDSTNLGIGMSAVKNIAEDFDNATPSRLSHTIRTIRSWSLITALFGMLVCIVFSPLFNHVTFSWGNHTLHFVLLSPIIALMAVTTGEMAILKGTRRLKNLATVSICNVVGALLISVPAYVYFGVKGIIPSLLGIAIFQMLITVRYSYRYYPLHFSFAWPVLGQGMEMVRLGIAFVVAGIFGSGADFVIRSYLSHIDSLDMVGFYNAGYVITMTYASMVFSAMETDYFPRLSSVSETGVKLNLVANRQIEVSILLMAPLLTFFMVFMPILLPLLYSGKFAPVINMAQIAIFSMYLRAVYLPVEYISLSRRDSLAYLIQEAFSAVIMAASVIVGYRLKGLDGTGLGLSVSAAAETVFVLVYTRYRYRYALSRDAVLFLVCQLAIGGAAYGSTFIANKVVHLSLSGILIVASGAISYSLLKKKTHWGLLLKLKHPK